MKELGNCALVLEETDEFKLTYRVKPTRRVELFWKGGGKLFGYAEQWDGDSRDRFGAFILGTAGKFAVHMARNTLEDTASLLWRCRDYALKYGKAPEQVQKDTARVETDCDLCGGDGVVTAGADAYAMEATCGRCDGSGKKPKPDTPPA